MSRNFQVASNRPIKPDDVKVRVDTGAPKKPASKQPNFLALTILWAHFQACERGLLREDQPRPWDLLGSHDMAEQKRWMTFLQRIITETSWTSWIQNEDEVFRRAVEAYQKQLLIQEENMSSEQEHGKDLS